MSMSNVAVRILLIMLSKCTLIGQGAFCTLQIIHATNDNELAG